HDFYPDAEFLNSGAWPQWRPLRPLRKDANTQWTVPESADPSPDVLPEGPTPTTPKEVNTVPTGSHTDPTTHHGWGWLDTTDPIPLTDRREPNRDNHLDATPAESPATSKPAEAGTGGGWAQRLPTPAWIALAVSLLVSGTVIGVGALTLRGQTTAPSQLPTGTAAPPPSTASSAEPSTTRVHPEACAGVTGDIVTDSPGDPSRVTGVIAACEHAYYSA